MDAARAESDESEEDARDRRLAGALALVSAVVLARVAFVARAPVALVFRDVRRVFFAAARFALSDSGGVQEEGPSLGVPVLVLREVSERPELIESGWGRLVGTDEEEILDQASLLLDDDAALESMKRGENPFGDGRSGARIARALADRAG